MKHIRTIYLILLTSVLLFLMGCSTGVVSSGSPKAAAEKVSIAYPAPGSFKINSSKYKNLSVGLLDFYDRRPAPFYEGDDNFVEKIPEDINDIFATEMRPMRVFKKVSALKVKTPALVTAKCLTSVKAERKFDLVIAGDIVEFNMYRNKIDSGHYTIMVEIGYIPQLIHVQSGKILWSGYISRSEKALAKTGKLTSGYVAEMTKRVMGQSINDMMKLMVSEGEWVR